MKSLYTLFIIAILVCGNLQLKAGTFVSKASGLWKAATSWSLTSGSLGVGYPNLGTDVAIIMSGNTITLDPFGSVICGTVTVNAGATLQGANRTLTMQGGLIDKGTIVGALTLEFTTHDCFLDVVGTTYSAKGGIRVFDGKTLTVTSNSNIDMQGYIELLALGAVGSKMINQGKINLTSAGGILGTVKLTGNNSLWTNDAASSLTVTASGTAASGATMDFTGTGSSVNINGNSNFIYPGNYYNLNVNSFVSKSLPGDVSVSNNMLMGGLTSNTISLNGKTLSLQGNLSCNGINGSTAGSKIVFNGTSGATQNVTGIKSFTVQTLEINTPSGGGVLLNNIQPFNTNKVLNTLLITDGVLNANSNLTLVSNASTTARIAPIVSGSITGNVTIEKYFPSFAARNFDLSSPTQGSVVMDWDDELYISGIGAYDGIGGPKGVDGDAIIPGSGLTANSMYSYDESSGAYTVVTGSNTPLVPGVGYDLWFEDLTNNFWDAKTINTVGVPNQGPVTLTLSGNIDGYHLIGNPYASAIDMTLLYDGAPSNVGTNYNSMDESDIEVLDGSGNFAVLDVSAGPVIIYPHQGFWVKALPGGGDLTFFEGCKTTDVTTAFNRKAANYDIKLVLSSPTTTFYHENIVNFNAAASTGFDKSLDHPFRFSPVKAAPAIFIQGIDEKRMIKNTINSQANEVTLPLGIFTPKSTIYYVDASILNLDAYQFAWIENVKTGKKYDLNTSAIAIEGEEGKTNMDFVLRLSKTEKSGIISQTMLESDLIIFNTEATINLKSTTNSHLLSVVCVYDMTGKLLVSQSNVNVELGNVTKIDVSSLANGVYIVNVIDEKGNSVSKKLIKQ